MQPFGGKNGVQKKWGGGHFQFPHTPEEESNILRPGGSGANSRRKQKAGDDKRPYSHGRKSLTKRRGGLKFGLDS